MKIDPKVHRHADSNIQPLFIERWSPRAMTGEQISDAELKRLFEAARWAPSSFNEQPWRFLYAKREMPQWTSFFSLLVEMNQAWAKNASVLLVIVSKKTFTKNEKPNRVHSFDAGAAWENLALQATAMDWAAHGMAGFDYERAHKDLGIPDDYQVEAMAAIGKTAEPSVLPEQLAKNEWPPSLRKPISEFVTEGKWKEPR